MVIFMLADSSEKPVRFKSKGFSVFVQLEEIELLFGPESEIIAGLLGQSDGAFQQRTRIAPKGRTVRMGDPGQPSS